MLLCHYLTAVSVSQTLHVWWMYSIHQVLPLFKFSSSSSRIVCVPPSGVVSRGALVSSTTSGSSLPLRKPKPSSFFLGFSTFSSLSITMDFAIVSSLDFDLSPALRAWSIHQTSTDHTNKYKALSQERNLSEDLSMSIPPVSFTQLTSIYNQCCRSHHNTSLSKFSLL